MKTAAPLVHSYAPKLATETAAPSSSHAAAKRTTSSLGGNSTTGRELYVRADVLTQCTGSAMLELGKTKVLCSVYGPRAPQQTQLQQRLAQTGTFAQAGTYSVYCRYARFARRIGEDNADVEAKSRALERLLKDATEGAIQLHKFPKAVVDLHLLVLEDGGGVAGAAITCAGVALASAGIDMLDLPVGCHLGSVGGEGQWTVADREGDVTHTAILAMLPLRGEVTALNVSNVNGDDATAMDMGGGDGLALERCLELGARTCEEIAKVCREELRQRAIRKRVIGGGGWMSDKE